MDQLADFEAFSFVHDDERRTVYRSSPGPAALVMFAPHSRTVRTAPIRPFIKVGIQSVAA